MAPLSLVGAMVEKFDKSDCGLLLWLKLMVNPRSNAFQLCPSKLRQESTRLLLKINPGGELVPSSIIY